MQHEIDVRPGVTLRYAEQGRGRPFLVLHGGGGPFTVARLAAHLSDTRPARTIEPTMPGFDGTARPAAYRTIGDVAGLYLDLLDVLDLEDVTLVGSSAGGWVAAAMAVALGCGRSSHGHRRDRVGALVLVNAVGITVPGSPITNVSGLRIDQLADLSYFEPDRFRIDPAGLPAERRAAMAANAAVFADYAGNPYMHDPALRDDLAGVDVPTLVLWGEADRIVDLDYGRGYAAAIPGAAFRPVARAGHLPHVEQPDVVRDLVWEFAQAHAGREPVTG